MTRTIFTAVLTNQPEIVYEILIRGATPINYSEPTATSTSFLKSGI